jgi:hypothetical protein
MKLVFFMQRVWRSQMLVFNEMPKKNGSDEAGISNNAQEQSSLIARLVALTDRRCAAPVQSSR